VILLNSFNPFNTIEAFWSSGSSPMPKFWFWVAKYQDWWVLRLGLINIKITAKLRVGVGFKFNKNQE
jgi:hypothetical protein